MKISEAFSQYEEEEVLAMGGSLNTSENYKYACKAFISELGNIEVENITMKMVKRFTVEFRKDHSMRTVRNYLACLRSVIGMCEGCGLEVISADSITLPKVKIEVPTFINDDEVDKLIEAARIPVRGYPKVNRFRNELIIKMLYCTGLRVSELCNVDIHDIRDREFTVVGKSKEPRTCYITEEVEDMIKEYIEMRSDHNPALFVSEQTNGKRLSTGTVQLMFRRVRKLAGLDDVHPHTMRHSFCTKLLESGVDIRDTAELMGHQSWNTTKIYTHISNERLKNIYNRAMSDS